MIGVNDRGHINSLVLIGLALRLFEKNSLVMILTNRNISEKHFANFNAEYKLKKSPRF